MRHQLKKHVRAFVCRIAAASLILGMAAPGIYPAEETADKGTRLRAGAAPETETKSEIKPAAEIKAKADTMNREHRKERITISGVEDLAELAGRCVLDTNSRDFEVVLTKDITLTGISFTPIPYFSGIFDGQGHTIRGIAILSDGSSQGFMRFVGEGAVIRNLNVEGRIEPDGEAQNIGGIAGSNAGTILNCSFRGSVRAKENGGSIAGINEESGLIAGCSFEGKVTAQHRAGGIAGLNCGSILSCTSLGEVNTGYIETDAETKSTLAADLAGISSFDVSSVSQEDFVDIMDVGGIAGYSSGTVSECRNAGKVGYAHTGYNVGGIAGRSSGFTADCTNEADVLGRKDVGGILGQLEPESIWQYSRSRTQELKSQLNQLNALLDTLASDVSDSSGAIRDDIASASGYADSTIRDLQVITDDVSGDIEKSSSAFSEAVAQLEAAVDENDAEALKNALAQLAQEVSGTELLRRPVNVTVQKDTQSDLSTLLDAREANWWKKLDQYLNSREQSSGQRIVPNVQPQPDAQSQPGVQPQPDVQSQPDELFQPDGQPQPDSTGSDAPAPADPEYTDPDPGVPEPDDSQVVIPDPGIFEESVPVPDDGAFSSDPSGPDDGAFSSDPAWQDASMADIPQDIPQDTPQDISQDIFQGMSQDISQEIPQDTGDGEAFVPDDGQAVLVAEDSTMTGAEDGSIQEDGGDSGLIVEETDGDGSSVLNIEADRNRTYSLGENDLVDSSRDTSAQVSVDANLPDTSRLRTLLQTVLTDSSMLLDPAALSNAMTVLKGLEMTPPDTGSFYDNFQNLSSSVVPIADDARSLAGKAAEDVDAITDQLDAIIETFFSLADSVSLDDRYVETDVSLQDPYQSDSSSVDSCKNTGEVNGDTNAGGIAGCIGFENQIDAEGVLDVSKYLLKDARYTIFAAERGCYNKGSVTAKKEAAGGITGSMEFGIITDCVNTGAVSVETGDFCGGICGTSRGAITKCCAGSLLTGGAYTGGIAGRGTTLSDCISYSYVDSRREYRGAVAGCADGTVSGCWYVDYGTGGIDNVGYTGVAQPMPHVSGQTGRVDGSGTSGSADAEAGYADADSLLTGNVCRITFLVGDEVYREVDVPFGGALKELPEVPNRGDDYWVWDEFDREHVFRSRNVTGAYHRATTTLSSGGDVPDYLAEGVFYEGQELTVTEYVVDESPVSTESVADLIGERIHELHYSQETEGETGSLKGFGSTRQEVRRIITDRLTGPLLDAKTLSVNDYDKDLTVRVRAGSGGRLFTDSGDGDLKETSYKKDGSYIVFGLKNGGSFAYYETLRQNKDMRGRIAIGCGIAAAAVLALILLIRRHRKKRRKK